MTRDFLIKEIDKLYTQINTLVNVPMDLTIKYLDLCSFYSKLFGAVYNGHIIY